MKKWNKATSVGLSLVLCLGMVAPAFAASFSDLQNAIDGNGGVDLDNGRTGWAETTHEDGTKTYGIEAWQSNRTVDGEDDGETRYIQLNEDVKYDADEDGEDYKTITIAGDGETTKDVTIDLKGNDIDAGNQTGSSVITVEKTGALTINDSTARTETDGEGNEVYKSGKITKGSIGGVLNQGTLTLNSGAISDNVRNYGGGGVFNDGGTFTMNGGAISGNFSAMGGGGVRNSGTFTMNGGAISDNRSKTSSGGVGNNGTFTMNGGVISGNSVSPGAGGVNNVGTFEMNGGAVWNNTTYANGDPNISGTVNWGNPDWEACPHEEIKKTEADGVTTYTCSNCGMSYSDPYGEWTWTMGDASAGNCTPQAAIRYENKSYSVSYIGIHTPGEAVEENRVEPQVGKAGSYDEVVYCADCGAELSREEKAIPALTEDNSGNGGGNGGTTPGGTTPGGTNPGGTTPGGTTPGGNGGNSGNGDTPDNSANTPAEIADSNVPLADAPEAADAAETIGDDDVPLSDLPEAVDAAEAIGDDDVPLSDLPETVDIDDSAVPLGDGNVPQTGEASTALWAVVLLACGMGLVYVNTGKRKKNA